MSSFNNQFGLMVAYLLPGFIGLAGIAPFVPLVAAWLRPGSYAEASVGAPVYAVLAASTIGMIVSCFRWLIIDQLHRSMGIPSPRWDDSRLADSLGAFNYLVENHYRYYQFFANTLVAVAFAYSINRWMGTSHLMGAGTDISVLILCIVLFVGSRDALAKYYLRTSRVFGSASTDRSEVMTNGNHHDGGTSSAPQPKGAKREVTPQRPANQKQKTEKTKPTK